MGLRLHLDLECYAVKIVQYFEVSENSNNLPQLWLLNLIYLLNEMLFLVTYHDISNPARYYVYLNLNIIHSYDLLIYLFN